VADLSK